METDDTMALTEWDAAGVYELGRFAAANRCAARRDAGRVIFTRNRT